MPYFFSQWPWIMGERECAIGWPQTNAFFISAIYGAQVAQFVEQRQQWQADDGEMVALDLVEELDALALDLVGADRIQRHWPDPRQMPPDKGRLQLAHRQPGDADMPP